MENNNLGFFKKFIDKRTKTNNNNDKEYKNSEEEINEEGYAHREGITIKNRFKDLFNSSIGRLESTYKRFLKTKKGTCWELAQSLDYYYLKQNVPNHHIVAVKTNAVTCHTFNIYVDDNNTLHVIDLYMKLKDTPIKTLENLEELSTYDKETDENKIFGYNKKKDLRNWDINVGQNF